MPLRKLFFFLIPFALSADIVPKETAPQSAKHAPLDQTSPLCYITPPKGWEIAASKNLSKSVQIAFFKKTSSSFSPSINLAVEKSTLSLQEYLKVIRKIHEADHRNRWRQLGKVHTQAGIGQLTEIDTTTEWGSIRMLQLIVVKHGHAYVITAAASKEDMAQYYKEFQTTFRTLQVTSDLIGAIPQMQRRESLQLESEHLLSAWQDLLSTSAKEASSFNDPAFQKAHWIPFQNKVIQDYEDMGAHWQVLVLKAIQENMLSLMSPCEEAPSLQNPEVAKLPEQTEIETKEEI